MNFEELKSRDIAELRLLAAKYSIRTHPKHKAETIAKLIVEHITAKPPHGKEDVMKHKAELPPEPAPTHTEEAVREAIVPFAKKEGYLVTFPGDSTVIFKYRGAEESIHLSASIRTIRMKAESISRGAALPRAIKDVLHGGASDLVMMV